MKVHQGKNFSIYFGDQEQSVCLAEIAAQQRTQSLNNIAQILQVTQIALLLQNHGVQGLHVTGSDHQSYLFSQPGDYLITQKKMCGIGVVTADCLPIVIYDPIHHAAGIVHAGWKGLLAGIFQIAVDAMVEKFHTDPKTLEIYVGPAAGPCCYEVQQEFIDRVKNSIAQDFYTDKFFIFKDEKTFFDATIYLHVIATNLGIKQENIYTRYNLCTISTLSFCSYRREKDAARRQVTMISLY
jgi:YfiH family protein